MTSSPSIHFHGGIGTIGGTKIIVQDGDFRVIFDFGLSYAPGGEFWGGRIQPRTGAARLKDFLTLGYVPRLDGLYRPDACAAVGLEPGRGERTQVFISHLHLDHMAVLDLLADDVPVWMHADSLRLYRAVAETGASPAVPAGARDFAWGQEIQVGPITVLPLAVDHDIPGAAGLLIKTSAGTVAYTGDLRLHGSAPERTVAFMAAARAAEPRMLLVEGTRLGEPEPLPNSPARLTEPEVPGKVVEHLARTAGLALITLYPRNTVRIANIAAAVKQAGRTLVLSPESAYIHRAMGGDLGEIAVYRRSTDGGGTRPAWFSALVSTGVEVLDAAAIRANQPAYLLQLNFWELNELVDLQPQSGSIFIHSNGEPLGRFDPAWEVFVRWLDHFKLELCWAACTGHAAPADLHEVVAGIRPQILMPIHSRTPELMEVAGINRTLPELGAIYDIATGARIG
ncbi:MAG TPA: MBL fold metallo-hydrolase [Symbiobacteriaceae bacterium]|jgi:ribonuclease J